MVWPVYKDRHNFLLLLSLELHLIHKSIAQAIEPPFDLFPVATVTIPEVSKNTATVNPPYPSTSSFSANIFPSPATHD